MMIPSDSDFMAQEPGMFQLEIESKQLKPKARPSKDWNEEYKKFAHAYELMAITQ